MVSNSDSRDLVFWFVEKALIETQIIDPKDENRDFRDEESVEELIKWGLENTFYDLICGSFISSFKIRVRLNTLHNEIPTESELGHRLCCAVMMLLNEKIRYIIEHGEEISSEYSTQDKERIQIGFNKLTQGRAFPTITP